MKMKFCEKCRTKLPLAAFYKNEFRVSGASKYCKECEPIKESDIIDKEIKCPKCGRDLPVIAFYKNKLKKRGRECCCIECVREKQRKYEKSLLNLDKAEFIL